MSSTGPACAGPVPFGARNPGPGLTPIKFLIRRGAYIVGRGNANGPEAMTSTLVLYHSGYGHTRKIAERLRLRLTEAGQRAHAAPLDAPDIDLVEFDRIVIGASIRNGKHKPPVHEFIRRHLDALQARPGAFFSVNLVARKPGKNTPETNPYLRAFLDKCPWRPDHVAVFAGNLDYKRYSWSDRLIIRFIMRLTGGPTDPATDVEFTDWGAVDRFAHELAGLNRRAGGVEQVA